MITDGVNSISAPPSYAGTSSRDVRREFDNFARESGSAIGLDVMFLGNPEPDSQDEQARLRELRALVTDVEGRLHFARTYDDLQGQLRDVVERHLGTAR